MSRENHAFKFISLAIVTDGKLEQTATYLATCHELMDSTFSEYEIVVILHQANDSEHARFFAEVARIPNVRVLVLSTRVSDDVAVYAALENAIGDYVVLIEPNADPIQCLPKIVAACDDGTDLVIGISDFSGRRMSALPDWLWSQIMAVVGWTLPRDASSLRCLSRRAVNAVTSAGRFTHEIHLRMVKTGVKIGTFRYTPYKGARNHWRGDLKSIMRTLIFGSNRFTRIAVIAGLICCFLAFLQSVFAPKAPAYQTLAVPIASLLFIGWVLVEYQSRTLQILGSERDYLVVKEYNTERRLGKSNLNVITQ